MTVLNNGYYLQECNANVHDYIHQVNGVKLADILFSLLCVVYLCALNL